jgi:membrane-bound lytic murein transglycosylase B
METNLGANTGKCTYKEVESVSVARYKVLLKTNKNWQASIDLLYKRQALFYDLMKTLGYSKDKKVSCSPAPSSYIGQGGAMGIPQFMSDVWKGYSSKITAKTGHKNPDPWSLTDGVMAMAIKLAGAGGTSSKESAIRTASINYLGTFNANYYNGIVYWSKNYKLLFQ